MLHLTSFQAAPTASFPTAGAPMQPGTPESAIKHTYDINSQRWKKTNITVTVSPTAMSAGTNRYVYSLDDGSGTEKVAKISKSSLDTRKEIFDSVIMQCKCQQLADLYNAQGPRKKVTFVDACIIELVNRPMDHTGGHPIMIMEPKMKGSYKKHSNNFGFVDKEDRYTPHAFSHFTYEQTKGQMIVVDIQGVGDNYTDPQIHSNIPTTQPPVWGQGDMGDSGIQKFFETHRCNLLCKQLGLSPHGCQSMCPHPSTAGLTSTPALGLSSRPSFSSMSSMPVMTSALSTLATTSSFSGLSTTDSALYRGTSSQALGSRYSSGTFGTSSILGTSGAFGGSGTFGTSSFQLASGVGLGYTSSSMLGGATNFGTPMYSTAVW